MYPILFSFGSFHLYSLSLFLIISWCIFSFLFWKLLRDGGVSEERIFDLTFYATLVTIILARVVFIALHFTMFEKDLLRTVALWVAPGLSLYGGLVGGVMTLVTLSRQFKVRVGYVLDSLALPLLGALMVGAVGAMLDGSEVGLPTSLPWSVRYVGYTGNRHPLGVYEIILFAILTVGVWFLHKRAKVRQWPYGLVGIWFFLLLSVGLFGMEFAKVQTVSFRGLGANQWILLGIIAETLGAFYVRGGGRAATRTFIRMLYAKITSRPT